VKEIFSVSQKTESLGQSHRTSLRNRKEMRGFGAANMGLWHGLRSRTTKEIGAANRHLLNELRSILAKEMSGFGATNMHLWDEPQPEVLGIILQPDLLVQKLSFYAQFFAFFVSVFQIASPQNFYFGGTVIKILNLC
jgi:hypothetical protein